MKKQTIVISDEPSRKRLLELVGALNLDKPWEVTVGRKTHRRSLSQNALYWKWMDVVGGELGYAKTEVHEIYREMFLAPIERRMGDKVVTFRPSTSDLTTADMQEYMDHVYRHATGELGIMLPVPEWRDET